MQPVVIASRAASNNAERWYSQLDLEVTAMDFYFRRLRNFLVGAPEIIVVTDHKQLCPIFNPYRQEVIQTDRIKLWHEDINYFVEYQCEKSNSLTIYRDMLSHLTVKQKKKLNLMN